MTELEQELVEALKLIESLVSGFYAGQGTTAKGSRDNIEAKRLALETARSAIAKATA